MPDDFTSLWRRLTARAPSLDPALAQDIVRDSVREVMERRDWSFLRKRSAFAPTVLTLAPDTVAVAANSPVVVSANSLFTPQMVGMQIRIGGAQFAPFTVLQYLSASTVLIDGPWAGDDQTAASYQVMQVYFTVPSDFQSFVSVINPAMNYRLWHDLPQDVLDRFDAQRANTGNAWAVSYRDNLWIANGPVSDTLPVNNTLAARPVVTAPDGFTFPSDLTLVLQITVGGTPGAGLQFTWGFADFAVTNPAITVTDNNAIDLQYGVQVYFPQTNYTLGSYFVTQCYAGRAQGAARYELWPWSVNNNYPYPYLYNSKPADVSDEAPTLPADLARRGDVILDKAQEKAASWPGTETRANTYYNLQLARECERKFNEKINELELRDDNKAMVDFKPFDVPLWPMAPFSDGHYLQSHDVGY